MKMDIASDVSAVLHAQVAAGAFATVEEALRAAVLGVPLEVAITQDLSWMKPMLDAAERHIAAGDTVDADEAFDEVLQHLATR